MFTTKKLYKVFFCVGLLIAQPNDIQADNAAETPIFRFDKIKKEKKSYQYYSQQLGVSITPQDNMALVHEISEWMGTPYQYGWSSKENGTDCSGFVGQVYHQVFDIQLQRNSAAIFAQEEILELDTTNLQMGDLLFFGSDGKNVEHIGIYLKDGKFVHASSLRKRGVIVARLHSEYHMQRFIGARRHIKIVREELHREQAIHPLFVTNQTAQISITSLQSVSNQIEAPKIIEAIPLVEPDYLTEEKDSIQEVAYIESAGQIHAVSEAVGNTETVQTETQMAIEEAAKPTKIVILKPSQSVDNANYRNVVATKGILIR